MEATNLSKIKREKLLHTISEIKKKTTDDEVLNNLSLIENELNSKKFGLVWEEHQENVDVELENKIPTFIEIKENEVKNNNDNNFNFLIEGDNLHSLYLLEKTHREKIDVIYIDPPYNTGAKTWRYNNDYVDKEDSYRHSKWIEMMKRRVEIAKKLLTPTGFFICAIDANELFSLGLLLDEIFGEDNRLGLVTVLHNPKGRNFTKWFSANSEYMLVYAKNSRVANFNETAIDEEVKKTFTLQDPGDSRKYRLEPFMRSRTETLRENKPNFWYPLFVSPDLKKITRTKTDGYHEVYPIASNGKEATWINLPETFDEKNKLGWFVAKKENNRIVIYRKLYEQQVYKNVWIDKKYHSEFNGTNVLKDILGKNIFDYPKSIYLMEDILKLTAKKDSIVLDFFAGSGTTGHAVMNLNQEDGGTRKFILCTNNENKICEEVTYQRIKTVITGKRNNGTKYSDGIKENLKYYRTDFIPRINTEQENLHNNLLINIKNMIQLENHINIDDKTVIICINENEFDDFTKNENKLEECEKVYISSDILITNAQEKILENNNIELYVIPEYYFKDEIMEVTE